MTDIEVLKTIVLFLKENVASNIKLKKPPENNQIEGEYELVNPAVFEGWMPPKNLNDDCGYDIPCIVAMIDDGVDDNYSANLYLRFKIITYDAGTIKEDNTIAPNVQGYKDLLNVITKIRRELSQNPIIKEKVNINKPIKWSMDKEQSYPYWSADLSFTVSIAPLEFNIERCMQYDL